MLFRRQLRPEVLNVKLSNNDALVRHTTPDACWFFLGCFALLHFENDGSMAAPTGSDRFASIDDLSKENQAFLQAEVMLRPGISDLPGESVRNFLERFLRTPMDNGQRAHIIKIVKQDNEYTVDLQLRNRTALLFTHILSPPVNGRAAMLQSVIVTVAFSQGRKVDPPSEQAIDPLEFVTFMSGVPGWR